MIRPMLMTPRRGAGALPWDESYAVKRVMVLENALKKWAMSRSQGVLSESPLARELNVKACFEVKGSSWCVCAPGLITFSLYLYIRNK